MKRRLEGKVAIVTGAGSRGEGWGNGMTIAILFAREGAQVLLVHRDEAVAQRTLSVIQEEGGSAAVYRGDVAIEADLKGMVDAAVTKFGGLDILVNNVGPHSQPGLFNESEEAWNLRFRVNVTSVFLSAKFAVPHMIERGGGRIINISSISALRSGRVPGYAYAASKAALQRLTKDLALEFRNCASASGLASASTFLTGRPWTTSRTASSTILPLLVRGMSLTCTTWPVRGAAWCCRRICCRIFLASAASRVRPSRRRTNSTTRTSFVRRPVLADGDAFDHFVQLFDLAVDFGGADAHAAGIERGIRAAIDDQAAVP
jgi:NAD(P)-dependent dehydrogenase (short-subunit alcohol dehydrogenase family)